MARHGPGVLRAGQGPAYAPWTTWRTDAGDGPLALVRAGILAANPHNTQPWLFRVMDTQIEVYADASRNLGAFDPYLREMYIGLGCAVENMVLAAAANGYAASVTLAQGTLGPMPSIHEPTRVAQLALAPRPPERSTLYDTIPRRHTHRGPYDTERSLSPDALATLRTVAAKLLPRPAAAANHAYWLDGTRDVQVATASVFGFIAVRDLYDTAQTLRAGRLWQRTHLWATTQGIAMQPLNQPVELIDRERALGKEPHTARALDELTADPTWKPTFVFRAGYPVREASASPRRPVEDVVV